MTLKKSKIGIWIHRMTMLSPEKWCKIIPLILFRKEEIPVIAKPIPETTGKAKGATGIPEATAEYLSGEAKLDE